MTESSVIALTFVQHGIHRMTVTFSRNLFLAETNALAQIRQLKGVAEARFDGETLNVRVSNQANQMPRVASRITGVICHVTGCSVTKNIERLYQPHRPGHVRRTSLRSVEPAPVT